MVEEGQKAASRQGSPHSGRDGARGSFHKKAKGSAAYTASRGPGKQRVQCSFCQGGHFIRYCLKFTSCTLEQRNKHVVEAKLCRNCLNDNHTVESFRSAGRCLICNGKHNSKLHTGGTAVNCISSQPEETVPEKTTIAHACSDSKNALTASTGSKVLLSTVCVTLRLSNDQSMTVRALLDSGAEECFVSEHLGQALSLNKSLVHVTVSGVGGETSAVSKSRVAVLLKSAQDTNFYFNISALVLKKLTALIPHSPVSKQSWSHLSELELADPHFDRPSRIDCIFNSEVYAAVLLPGMKKGSSGMPFLNTIFGWVLMGATASDSRDTKRLSLHHAISDSTLTEAVARFWKLEEVPMRGQLSPQEEAYYAHFHANCARNEDGRFVVRLPFIQRSIPSDTKLIAEACMKRLVYLHSRTWPQRTILSCRDT